ncbi:hypothetical protein FHR99_002576 [Litorivivens lipolytica]|uniref:YARHG domain-containing protein n=1 Tax=Litorivivens lipolytica TaxID=1524264 RepID=A0A7W4Z6K5_9GAMM|nr:hypothetical protein [Litorivivens lipolytica]MBB3048302.1 hypothetical protein [Litorivivens lipolytica]
MKRFLIIGLLSWSCLAQAVDWSDCRRGKLDALSLEQALRKGHMLRGYPDRSAMREALRERNDWLWRNCRRYSGKMRDLSIRR